MYVITEEKEQKNTVTIDTLFFVFCLTGMLSLVS